MGLEITTAGEFPLGPRNNGWVYRAPTVALHLHGYAGEVRIGRCRFVLRPGDLTISPANVPSRYQLTEEGSHWCVHFVPDPADRWKPLHRTAPPFAATTLQWLAESFHAARAPRKRAGREGAAEHLLRGVLAWLTSAPPVGGNRGRVRRSDREIARAAALLSRHLRNPPALEELAAHTQMNAAYFSRRFREQHGVSVARYVLDRRIALARHLLRTTDAPVKEIAVEVGIPDAQYFNKQFRRIAGEAPSAWRARYEGPGGGESRPQSR